MYYNMAKKQQVAVATHLFAKADSYPCICTPLAQLSNSPCLSTELELCAFTVCLWQNSPSQMPPPPGSFPCLLHSWSWVGSLLTSFTFCLWPLLHCNLYYSIDNGYIPHTSSPNCEPHAASRLVPSCCCISYMICCHFLVQRHPKNVECNCLQINL